MIRYVLHSDRPRTSAGDGRYALVVAPPVAIRAPQVGRWGSTIAVIEDGDVRIPLPQEVFMAGGPRAGEISLEIAAKVISAPAPAPEGTDVAALLGSLGLPPKEVARILARAKAK